MGLTRNDSGSDQCGWCGDTGWVALNGTVNGYSRGVTACRWCELGTKRYNHATTSRDWKGTHLETNFTEADVDAPTGFEKGRPKPSSADMRAYIAKIRKASIAMATRNRELKARPQPTSGEIVLSKAELKLINDRIAAATVEAARPQDDAA